MSLSSSLGKITSFTRKLTDATNPSFSGANVSVGAWGKYIGLNDLSFNSITSTRNSIENIKSSIAQTINIGYCVANFLSNSDQILGFLDQLFTGAMGAISSVVDEIYDAVAYQISRAVNQVFNSFISLVDALKSLIGSIMTLCGVIVETISSWFDWSNLKLKLDLQEENCKDMFATIAACFLNKFLGSYLDEFTKEVTDKINQYGNDINAMIYEGLQDVETFSAFARQESFLLHKASIQIQGFTKESLLGS